MSSFQAIHDEMENIIKELKKKHHFTSQGVRIDRVAKMAKEELGSDFLACVNPEDVQWWLKQMKPRQMIITQTSMKKKEVNHAIPIVCEKNADSGAYYVFEPKPIFSETYYFYILPNSKMKLVERDPKWTPNVFFAFDTFSKYGKFGHNPQPVLGHPFPEWFKYLLFVNKHPTQSEDTHDCAIRAVAWLKMYQKYGRLLIELYF